MRLHWGCGCVREEDRPLISCFLSLGKGGALWCCPCFLMSALETTKTSPVARHTSATRWYLVHLTHLKQFVSEDLTSFFFPSIYSPPLFSRYYGLPFWQLAPSLSSNNKLFSRKTFSQGSVQKITGIGDNYAPQWHIIAFTVPSRASIDSVLSSQKGGLIWQNKTTEDNKLLECLNIVEHAITFSVWGRAAGSSSVDLRRGGSLKLHASDSFVLCWGLIKESSH